MASSHVFRVLIFIVAFIELLFGFKCERVPFRCASRECLKIGFSYFSLFSPRMKSVSCSEPFQEPFEARAFIFRRARSAWKLFSSFVEEVFNCHKGIRVYSRRFQSFTKLRQVPHLKLVSYLAFSGRFVCVSHPYPQRRSESRTHHNSS